MEIGLAKFRFKKDKKEMWLNWAEELMSRRDEVMETLRNEGVQCEACFLSESDQCLYYVIEAESFEKMQEVARKSTLAIDKKHKEVKSASIEFVERMEPLFYFSRN